jgi:hypothetical protein
MSFVIMNGSAWRKAILQGCDTEIVEELLAAHMIVTNRAALQYWRTTDEGSLGRSSSGRLEHDSAADSADPC